MVLWLLNFLISFTSFLILIFLNASEVKRAQNPRYLKLNINRGRFHNTHEGNARPILIPLIASHLALAIHIVELHYKPLHRIDRLFIVHLTRRMIGERLRS